MEINNFFVIISKRMWIMMIMPLIAIIATGIISFYLWLPVYESSMTLYVINKSSDQPKPLVYDDVLVSQTLVKDYKEIIKSRSVAEMVINQLAIKDMSADDLRKKISVDSKNDTRIIEIKVEDGDPVRAQKIADSVGNAFLSKAIEFMKVDNIHIVDKAVVPNEPIRPKPLLYMVIAFIMGVISSVAIIFLIEYTDTTVKTREDVERYLALPVLGMIPLYDEK